MDAFAVMLLILCGVWGCMAILVGYIVAWSMAHYPGRQ